MANTPSANPNSSPQKSSNPPKITIWQQNVNKSSTCQHDLISSARLAKRGIDIIALQEPAINVFGVMVAARDWIPIYPSTHGAAPHKTRSIILLRSNILTDQWKQIDFPSSDVTVIQLSGERGSMLIFNIYNDCNKNDTIHLLEAFHHSNRTPRSDMSNNMETTIWLGDFNRHHPHWDNPNDDRLFTRPAISDAEVLINAVAEAGLDLALPPGIPTHLHNVTKKWTRLDQVFITEDALDSIITCETLEDTLGINTDHLPILTTIDLELTRAAASSPKNFRNVDWEDFQKKLEEKLKQLPAPTHITTQGALNETCKKLTETIQETIEAEVPTSDLGTKAKRWWTKELSILRKNANKAGRKASRYRDWPEHPSHGEQKEANWIFQRTLENTKRQHWRDWLERVEDPDIWMAHKYTSTPAGDGGKCRIPVLKLTRGDQESTATTNEEKATMLARTFFPPSPPNDSPLHFVYPKPIDVLTPMHKEQIQRQIVGLKPYKAPGLDGIPNIVLMKCANSLVDRLLPIYKAMLENAWYYDPWKISTTVVLRKPGKLRYDTPKAYRPIALLNTLAKVLTAIVTDVMTYYTEKYQLLPANHFGGRPGRTTTDAVHLLVHKIKDAWRKRQVAAVLFLNIEGAFPNAVTNRLLHNLRKRKMPDAITEFAGTMLSNRSTILRFDDHMSESIALDNGIGQGDPLSMALYQFYNADILDIPSSPQEWAEAYVDDAILIATGKTFAEAHTKLADMMLRSNGMINWSKSHNSSIEYSKLALIDFSHHGVKKQRPSLVLPEVTITPTQSTKYLGIILDQNLNWKPQLAQIRGKGSTWTAQIKRLTRPTWGLTPKGARKLFISVALPRTLYGLDVWCTPLHSRNARGNRKGSVNVVKKLTTVQRAGALAVTGGLRTTPTNTLDAHASLLPVEHRVAKHCHRAITHIATLPQEHPLHPLIKKSAKGRIRRHRSPLHILTSVYGISPEAMEKIPPVRIHPTERGAQIVRIDIPSSKEASKEKDQSTAEPVKVYSDGSAHNSGVGAAAVLRRIGQPDRVLKVHLGPTGQHTVYEAELAGMILGLHLIKTEKRNKVGCVLNVDNQAALMAINSSMTKSGQHLAAVIHSMAKKLLPKGGGSRFSLTFRWSAGHVGIEGNEIADEEAKSVAEGDSSEGRDLPAYLRKPVKHSLSATHQSHKESLKKKWANTWSFSPRYHRARYQDMLTPASQNYLKYICSQNISRAAASRIFQLRVGHIPLNQYLHRFKRVDNPRCPACGHPNETVEHYLVYCPKYAHERWPLLRRLGNTTPKVIKLLTNRKLLAPLINYIEATERFQITGGPDR
jgi:ribonuclease HI